jgi:hypothetical protein
LSSDLSESEQDLLSHVQDGYDLETDSLGGDPLLRHKDKEPIRPLSTKRNTVTILRERGLIAPVKGSDPLRTVWRLNKSEHARKSRVSSPRSPG